MRRVLSLLLTAAMVLSLLVVAGAEQQTVTLKTAKSVNGSEVTYTFTLDATGTKGVGALSFDVETTNLTFKAKSDVYNPVLDTTFMPGVPGVQDGSYGFYTATNRFIAYGGDGAKEGTRLLKDSVQLVSLTYIIADTSADYELKVTEFKACYSGAEAMTTNKYNCEIAPITDSEGVTVTPQGTALEDAYTVSGQTVTVTYSATCRVGYLQDGKYVTVPATQNGDAYDYVVPEGVTDVIVVVKGDVDGNGRVTNRDATLLRGIVLQKETATLSAAELFAVDADGNGRITNRDATLIRGAVLAKETLPQG